MVLWALLQCLMLVPIVVLVCIVATPGTFPIRAHGSMGSTPVSILVPIVVPGLCCSRTPSGHMVLWALLQCLMLVPIVVLVCIVAAPGTFPIRAHGSMGSTPVSHACAYSCPGLYCSPYQESSPSGHMVLWALLQLSHACAYSCPGLYCSRTRNLLQGTWF